MSDLTVTLTRDEARCLLSYAMAGMALCPDATPETREHGASAAKAVEAELDAAQPEEARDG